MVDNGGIWDEQSFRAFEQNRDREYIRQLETENAKLQACLESLQSCDNCGSTAGLCFSCKFHLGKDNNWRPKDGTRD